MALKALIKDLSDVSKEIQSEYVKNTDGDGYILDVIKTEGLELQNVGGLKTALTTVTSERDTIKETLKSFGELKPADVLRKIKRYDEIKNLNPEKLKKEAVNEMRETIRGEFKEVIKKATDKVSAYENSLKSVARESIYSEITKAGGFAKGLKSEVIENTSVEIVDGKAVVNFVKDGKQRLISDDGGNTRNYSTKDFIKDMKNDDDYGMLFTTGRKSGAGGETNYQQNDKNVTYITQAQAASGDFIKEINNGTVQVK